MSVRKAAHVLNLFKPSLHRIQKHFLELHPFKISTHQLLTVNAMAKRLDFDKTITRSFEDRKLGEKLIICEDEAHFLLNGYVDKTNYRF